MSSVLLKISIDRPGDDWKYSSGFINAEMIEKSLFAPSEDNLVSTNRGQNTLVITVTKYLGHSFSYFVTAFYQVLMCGPPPMINFACVPNLDKLGYSQHQRFSY